MTGPSFVFDSIPTVVAGFTTRKSGVSKAPFDTLNLAVSSGDSREAVDANREILLSSVGFESGRLAIAGQVHGRRVARVRQPGLVRETDGLATSEPGLLLGIVAADCAVVLVADEAGTAVGAAHAGWRGAVAGIVNELLDTMTVLGSPPSKLQAYISPCISQKRFEVGPEVAEQFPREFVRICEKTGKPHVDLAGSLRAQLIGGGVRSQHVQVDGRCTFDDDSFYSYRADRGKTGRMMGYIGVRPSRRATRR